MTIIKYYITEFYKIAYNIRNTYIKQFINSANKKNDLLHKNNQTSISFLINFLNIYVI